MAKSQAIIKTQIISPHLHFRRNPLVYVGTKSITNMRASSADNLTKGISWDALERMGLSHSGLMPSLTVIVRLEHDMHWTGYINSVPWCHRGGIGSDVIS